MHGRRELSVSALSLKPLPKPTSVVPPPRTVYLSQGLYPPPSIDKACAAFSELCSVEQDVSGDDVRITIIPLEGSPAETVDEFLNYALCAAIETHLAGSV